ncbi:MAG: hypothetical protein DI628_07400 [Blastochloris viridis]|uniref:Uncharacterized protein n=1 Tax=Blastochloris viridis TaxID=1079 RepID=A0A6N4R984_BLAVI|nr:MAG: hypothetical protein DI628_07400 [Blastochloris viridis]
MTPHVSFQTHRFWRNFMCFYAFITGVIFYIAFWNVIADAELLRIVLPVIALAIVGLIGIAGHCQRREYPDGLILSTLVLTVIGIYGCMSVLYYTLTDTNPTHAIPMVFMGLSTMLVALFLKNMAAVFLFSRKDTP